MGSFWAWSRQRLQRNFPPSTGHCSQVEPRKSPPPSVTRQWAAESGNARIVEWASINGSLFRAGIFRNGYLHGARAGAPCGTRGEKEVIEPTVRVTAALGPHSCDWTTDTLRVARGIAVASRIRRLVLLDRCDGNRHGVTVRVGHTGDTHINYPVVSRPYARDRWRRTRADWR